MSDVSSDSDKIKKDTKSILLYTLGCLVPRAILALTVLVAVHNKSVFVPFFGVVCVLGAVAFVTIALGAMDNLIKRKHNVFYWVHAVLYFMAGTALMHPSTPVKLLAWKLLFLDTAISTTAYTLRMVL